VLLADSATSPADELTASSSSGDDGSAAEPLDTAEPASSARRRRRRRGTSDSEDSTAADSKASTKSDAITKVEGSTRVEAKKQRRREGRDAGRRRAPILSESEFLARREAVDRVMAIRQRGGTTEIAVLEDGVLVEHYVALESQTSMIGNVYLGRVQNVLPSMEAAFVDIGKGRNAVLYAGEVDWTLRGDLNQPRRIENALKAGQTVLVQVTKDPVGHKGGRLTSQISLPGRYLVYVPGGGTNGISRKLPDTERNRLKAVLKDIVPEEAGVIIRTAAEGASEEELKRDVARLTARWDDIEKKTASGQAPHLLYAEPDTTIKVVRDLFTEDFTTLIVSGEDAWDLVDGYVSHVAPDLADRLQRYPDDDLDVFEKYRIDEQIAKALERKVWLPSGGSLVIDRTEAMTVVDVNTGKFTGAGGNLEQTVTKNNLEAAEEIVRQLRLRDIGGIIVIDFIDMVLEENRDLVLRRLVECLGRDRTRHQVAEVTSLGLVQMTRKRISTGLLEAFSTPCETCSGRGVVIRSEPVGDGKPSGGSQGRSASSQANGDGGSGQSTDDNGAGRRNGSRGGRQPKASADEAKVSTDGTDEARVSTDVTDEAKVSTDVTDESTDHQPENLAQPADAPGELATTP
jgi:ribonuclease E